MISEREFAAHFTSFWRATLPNLESVVRSLNLTSRTDWLPIREPTSPERRDLVAETAFEAAAARFEGDIRPVEDLLGWAEDRARTTLNGVTRGHPIDAAKLEVDEFAEVSAAQVRIIEFAHALGRSESVEFRPRFSGHGFLSDCVGDLKTPTKIIEIKYVQRNFRSNDFRQALIYATLSYLKCKFQMDQLILMNPFKGIVSEIGIEEIVHASGGLNFEEFSVKFSYYLSSGELSR